MIVMFSILFQGMEGARLRESLGGEPFVPALFFQTVMFVTMSILVFPFFPTLLFPFFATFFFPFFPNLLLPLVPSLLLSLLPFLLLPLLLPLSFPFLPALFFPFPPLLPALLFPFFPPLLFPLLPPFPVGLPVGLGVVTDGVGAVVRVPEGMGLVGLSVAGMDGWVDDGDALGLGVVGYALGVHVVGDALGVDLVGDALSDGERRFGSTMQQSVKWRELYCE